MTFAECVLHCFDNRELVNGFNRLTGCSLGEDHRSQFDKLIDHATGHQPPAIDEAEALLFIAFVDDCIWSRLPPEAFATPAVPTS